MVIGASDNEVWTACLVAALLEDRDVVRSVGPLRNSIPEDVGWRLECIDGISSDDRIDRRAAARVREQARDILRRSRRASAGESVDIRYVGSILLRAFPDRLAVRKPIVGQYQLRTGSAAWISKDSELANEQFLVAADLDGDRKTARIRMAASISAEEITDLFADNMTVDNRVTWDRDRNDIVNVIEWRLDGMRLREVRQKPAPGDEATQALVDRVQSTSLQSLPWTDAAMSVRERVRFLHSRDGAWPDWSNKALLATLDTWLAPYLAGCTSQTDVEGLNLAIILRSGLPYELGPHLDELAPERITLPTGKDLKVTYRGEEPPMLSARVQAFYGVDIHPAICDGNVPLVVELLSPADRPIQVTSDLPSFWTGSWAEVRKDMAGRYPKHSWPTNPNMRD
jgi:ATP-dependent helicase HrpB